ncbi:cobalamin biosynthesis protein [Sphingomonas carotinifaciens]|uniref:cobalamin biosynthesis protein n=1 Tax=Sphingomonas carotinifaciens TaxID=1166323 RepID=UPI000DD4F3A4|nr:cobalamin biosynthesis protein [Sphingomonas carotinifaciens]
MIVAGFGARASATTAAFHAALRLTAHGHPPVTVIAAPQDRAAMLDELAALLDLPLVALPPHALVGIATPTRSSASLEHRGIGSVAEACALAAAGPAARLLATRRISPDRTVTCAIARGILS